jgi:hypothetical protein
MHLVPSPVLEAAPAVALAPVIRLFGFRPTRPSFDNVLRDWIVPAICGQPGVIDAYAGRRGPDELGPRLVVSAWESAEAMAFAFGASARLNGLDPEAVDGIADASAEVRRAEIAEWSGPLPDRPRIIRIIRGTAQAGGLEAYIAEARAGVAADIAAGHGPTAFYLARGAGEDSFVAISVWTAWEAIEQATGGDIRRPTATRHPELIASWEAAHFEALDP